MNTAVGLIVGGVLLATLTFAGIILRMLNDAHMFLNDEIAESDVHHGFRSFPFAVTITLGGVAMAIYGIVVMLTRTSH